MGKYPEVTIGGFFLEDHFNYLKTTNTNRSELLPPFALTDLHVETHNFDIKYSTCSDTQNLLVYYFESMR